MIQTLKLIVQVLPIILEMTKQIEDAIPERGNGKEKLSFVRDVFEHAMPEVMHIWGHVEFIVSRVVNLYNAVGIFHKSK
jgi:hypothetical protein